jgi:nicotinate-nucleotide adenylyltransferase
MQKKPIGIIGGTFDPIHLGHLHLAHEVYTKCELEKIIFIPCNQSPLRKPPIASGAARLAMLKIATENYSQYVVDARELEHQKPSYTFDTLCSLRADFMDASLCVIMGNDAFCKFNEWHRWQNILELAHIIVATRNPTAPPMAKELAELVNKNSATTAKTLQDKPYGNIYFVNINPLPISATQIRTAIKKNEIVDRLLPKKVWQYINTHKLYQ